MHTHNTKKTIKITVLAAICLFLLAAGTVVYAYFSSYVRVYTENGSQIAQIGMNLSLLFDRLDGEQFDSTNTDIISITTEERHTDGDTTVDEFQTVTYRYDPNAEWGSPQNPYIISDIKHLQNLSALQSIGYFDNLFIKNNYTEQNDELVYNGGTDRPYFIICKRDGTPVVIDGSNISINPVGTDEYPFIGYVGGAFNMGTELSPNTVAVGNGEGALVSPVSVIYNLNVTASSHSADFGLFGTINHLGETPPVVEVGEGEELPEMPSFFGLPSMINKLCLYDVSIIVEDSLWNDIVDLVHSFTWTHLSETDRLLKFHENHHIGILAGHVDYSYVTEISVYYSEAEKVAIDLLHASKTFNGEPANYYSASGILGFLNSLNPIIDDTGKLISTSGSLNSDFSNGTGIGGGGSLSGDNPGYVSASGMFDGFSYNEANRQNGQLVWEYTSQIGDTTSAVQYGIMLYSTGSGYTLEDGITQATVSGTTATAGTNSWTSYIIRSGTQSTGYTFTDQNGYDILTHKRMALYIKDGLSEEGTALCTEWVRQRLLWGTERTGRYYFYDGVFTFALSSQTDVIEPTWDNDKAGTLTIGGTQDSDWTTNTSMGNKAVVAYIKPITSPAELNTVTDAALNVKKDIFILVKTGTSAFLMTLNTKSTDTGSWGTAAYTTSGISKEFADREYIESLMMTINEPGNGFDELYPGMMNDLDSGALQVLQLGASDDIERLQQQYKIVPNRTTSGGTSVYSFYGKDENKTAATANYLRMMHRRRWGLLNYYNIYCGPDSDMSTSVISTYYNDSKDATLLYSGDASNPYFNIQFTVDGTTRYVYYSGSTFSSSDASSTQFYFYTVEGFHNMDFGRITFDPAEGSASQSFAADEYVLYPLSESYGSSTDVPDYTVKSISSLGWRNENGALLSAKDLSSKFYMQAGTSFAVNFNIGNGTLGTNGVVTAPVGSNGVNANIPMGCVAFRINKVSTNSKIRVIVAVPCDKQYIGETGSEPGSNYDLESEQYYLGVWKVEEAGGSFIQVFNNESSVSKVALPRSHPYEPGTGPSSVNSEYINLIMNGGSTVTNRAYLNGERILLAYEFDVASFESRLNESDTLEGVYILGYTVGKMEVVYFSADGVASAGRDGTGGTSLGTIDFVYSYDGKIVPVSDSFETGGDGNENYNTYYPTNSLLITNNMQADENGLNQFVNIHDEKIIIRRYIDPESEEIIKSALSLKVYSDHDDADKMYVRTIQSSGAINYCDKHEKYYYRR